MGQNIGSGYPTVNEVVNFIDGFPDGPMGKECICKVGNTGDSGFIPGSGRSPGIENNNPLHYFCLKNPMDKGAWWATVQCITKSQALLSDQVHTYPWLIHFTVKHLLKLK